MKTLKLAAVALALTFFAGCAKQEPQPVAMNIYSPDGDSEYVSGVSVVVTEDMIKSIQERMKKEQNLK